MYKVDRVQRGGGRHWFGALAKCGPLAKDLAAKIWQAKCQNYEAFLLNYSHNVTALKIKTLIILKIYLRGVLFSLPRLKSVPDLPAIFVSSWQQWSLGQKIWFGWLSAISQLASRVVGEGERGSRANAPYTVTLPAWTMELYRQHSLNVVFTGFFVWGGEAIL